MAGWRLRRPDLLEPLMASCCFISVERLAVEAAAAVKGVWGSMVGRVKAAVSLLQPLKEVWAV